MVRHFKNIAAFAAIFLKLCLTVLGHYELKGYSPFLIQLRQYSVGLSVNNESTMTCWKLIKRNKAHCSTFILSQL